MFPAHKLACLLVAAVMLIHTAHAASIGSDESGVAPNTAVGQTAAGETALGHHGAERGRWHAPSCVDDGRLCASVPGVAAGHAYQPGATARVGRVLQSSAIPVVPSRMAPRAMLPACILFGNFRS
jgi:hypothetical protein